MNGWTFFKIFLLAILANAFGFIMGNRHHQSYLRSKKTKCLETIQNSVLFSNESDLIFNTKNLSFKQAKVYVSYKIYDCMENKNENND